MSRSRKDGARGGGHVDSQCRELWSRRCRKVNMATPNRWSKRVTHRYERRIARALVRREADALAATPTPPERAP